QNKSTQFVAAKTALRVEEEEEKRPAAVYEEPEETALPPAQTASTTAHKHKDSDKNKEALNNLSNSLFAASLTDTSTSTADIESAPSTATDAVEEFRMPTRIGTGVVKASKKDKAAAATVAQEPVVPVPVPVVVAPIVITTTAAS